MQNIPSVFWLVPVASLVALGMALYFYLQMKKANEVSNYKQPTASEINSFYRKNSSMWVQPEYVEFAHVYKEKSDSQSENDARKAELEKASKEIASGAISFEEAVQKALNYNYILEDSEYLCETEYPVDPVYPDPTIEVMDEHGNILKDNYGGGQLQFDT